MSAIPLLLTVMLALTGCGRTGVEPSPSPSPSAGALFASEEEALAAAEAAYGRYQTVSDAVLADGGRSPERIDPVAIGQAKADALTSFETFRTKSFRSIGATTFGPLQLQAFGSGTEVVSAYLCLDISNVDVVNANGESVVSTDRPDRQAFEVGFVSTVGSSELVVVRRDAWEGGDICA